MSNLKYDFLLFENHHLATHHLFDLFMIARMMQSQGLMVAVFDVFHEIQEDVREGVPVIHWKSKCIIPDDSWMLRKHSKWETAFKSIKFLIQTHCYFKEVVAFIQNKADAFYCGSYHKGISTELFLLQKPCYYWGLRSERLTFTWHKLFPSPFVGLHVLLQRHRFLRNQFQRLFVSNPIILEEHIRIGVPRTRMVIREERVVEKMTDANLSMMDADVSFLVIGQLRKEKQIPVTIAAFRQANIPGSALKLIGRSLNDYEDTIENAISNDNRIVRVNEYLDYKDFFKYFSKSHFVLFADQQGPSCITNGTMMEALIHHRPVICPDYNPYKYYIEKYHIGLLYRPKDTNDYAKTIMKAANMGVSFFIPYIDEFLKTIHFTEVSKRFVQDIYNCGTMNSGRPSFKQELPYQ